MASNIEKQALNRLLMVISDEIEKEKFKKLTKLYDVNPQARQDFNHFDTLQYLHKKGVLDLSALVKNLDTIGCQDLSKKVVEFISCKENHATGQAMYPGGELVQPVPEIGREGVKRKPIEEQDGKLEASHTLNPL